MSPTFNRNMAQHSSLRETWSCIAKQVDIEVPRMQWEGIAGQPTCVPLVFVILTRPDPIELRQEWLLRCRET